MRFEIANYGDEPLMTSLLPWIKRFAIHRATLGTHPDKAIN
jgi:hypothetical protein